MSALNRSIAIGVAALIVLYLLFSSLYIVHRGEQAIVMRFGQITDVKAQPGLYFKLPTSLVDTVQFIDARMQRYDLSNLLVQVKGGQFYNVNAFLTYKVADARKFRERVQGSMEQAEARIGTRFNAALRQVYGLRDFQAALSNERTEMMKEARDLIRPDIAQLGIDVVDVRILRTDLTPDVSSQTYDRMKAERLAEAALIRAKGQQAAQTIRAVADRQSIEILADARRDSEILRGQGDAQRNEIFAAAYSVDPDFFSFYRSLQAYRTAMGANTGTTLVLSPDSPFFKFFENPGQPGTNLKPSPLAPAQLSQQPADASVLPGTDMLGSTAGAVPAVPPASPAPGAPAAAPGASTPTPQATTPAPAASAP
jgi:membrane protease subunit HflC